MYVEECKEGLRECVWKRERENKVRTEGMQRKGGKARHEREKIKLNDK